MTKPQAQAQAVDPKVELELAKRVLARRSLIQFTKRFYPQYNPGWVHHDIARRLEQFMRDIEEKKSPRLMLLVPPRHGKSELVSIRFPAFVLGHHPEWEVINCGYNLDLPMKFSRKVREIVRDPGYNPLFSKTQMDPDSQSAEAWNTTMGGGFTAAGVGGGITGKGATCVVPYCKVYTRRGIVPISQVKIGDEVYGYDHKEGRGKWTRVKAVSATVSDKPIIALGQLKVTEDHPVYNPDKQSYLPAVRWQEGLPCLMVQNVPYGESAAAGEINVHVLQKTIHAQPLRAREIESPRRDPDVLLTGLLQDRSQSKEEAIRHLHSVRGMVTYERPKAVLQRGMLQTTPTGSAWDGEVFRSVLDATDASTYAGQEMPAVQYEQSKDGHPSFGRRSGKQHHRQSRAVVPAVSQTASRILGTCAEDLADAFGAADYVVDLQTGTENFFCEGILVHNCLIIDDPIKNQEEADSIITRDGLWDWYWSTAYTRLAPGGGVLLVQCMTGDTPVLMPDGSHRRLDSLTAGEEVATYRQGGLSKSKVLLLANNSRDKIYKITTSSGKVVRANGRHPFLADHNGELKWVRTQALTTASRIVALKASGGSGAASPVPPKAAISPPSAAGSATPTTIKRSGLTDTARLASTPQLTASVISDIATGSISLSIGASTTSSAGAAPSADNTALTPRLTGKMDCVLTTTTIQGLCADSSATPATSQSDILDLSPLHVPLLNTSEFELDPVVSIEPDGEEDVYDLSVAETENFIANGLVTHNTWWHDDDLAGRLQQKMRTDEESDQFVIIKYPAIAEAWEYRNHATGLIERLPSPMDLDHVKQRTEQREKGISVPVPYGEEYELLRMPGEALHPERYNEKMMTAMKANQPVRIWSALYQQNPVPDEGMYFRKEYFKFESVPPAAYQRNVFQAWDFAIGEKQMNDYTVGATIIQDENDFLHVVEIVRFRGDSFTIVEEILNAAERWGGEPTAPLILGFEDSQIWKAIKPLLEKRMTERGMYPPYETLKPLTDKMARARSLQGRMQQGRVYFPQNAPWVNVLMTEFLRFPAGAHDDIVDAMAWAVNLCVGRTPKKKPEPKQPASWKDRLPQFVEGGTGSWMAS